MACHVLAVLMTEDRVHKDKKQKNRESLEKRMKRALRYFVRAAEGGNIAEAQYNAGLLMLGGRGVPEEREKGLKFLQKAAMQGHREAFMCYCK